MITTDYVRTMSRYATWQNESVFCAADSLDEAARREDRGAFFGSIHATLNHLMWGDQIWMSRFADTPSPQASTIPESVSQIEDWEVLKTEQIAFDGVIGYRRMD